MVVGEGGGVLGVEPALVGGIFEEAADEVGHAGDELADGDVFAEAPGADEVLSAED